MAIRKKIAGGSLPLRCRCHTNAHINATMTAMPNITRGSDAGSSRHVANNANAANTANGCNVIETMRANFALIE